MGQVRALVRQKKYPLSLCGLQLYLVSLLTLARESALKNSEMSTNMEYSQENWIILFFVCLYVSVYLYFESCGYVQLREVVWRGQKRASDPRNWSWGDVSCLPWVQGPELRSCKSSTWPSLLSHLSEKKAILSFSNELSSVALYWHGWLLYSYISFNYLTAICI